MAITSTEDTCQVGGAGPGPRIQVSCWVCVVRPSSRTGQCGSFECRALTLPAHTPGLHPNVYAAAAACSLALFAPLLPPPPPIPHR